METSITSSTSSSTTITPSSNKAAGSLSNLFLNEINYQDVYGILDVQRSLLEQLDKTNERLDGVNKFAGKRYLDAQRDFSSHTQMLVTMKNDLDVIFKRIRLLKMRLNKKYPAAYASVIQMNSNQNDHLDDEDEDLNDLSTSVKSVTSPSIVKSKTIDCLPSSATENGTDNNLAQITNNSTE